jgi:hypothetical protein
LEAATINRATAQAERGSGANEIASAAVTVHHPTVSDFELSALPPLFALLWPGETEAVRDLKEVDWIEIDRIARRHRLQPLLHAVVQRGAATPPKAILDVWRDAHTRAAMRALRSRATLREVGHCLDARGIEGCVLKGGAFVWNDWFDPALRPMRDLDVLVRSDIAEAAQAALLAAGFTVAGADTSDKHLPPLRSPRGIEVEIHRHVLDPYGAAWRDRDRVLQGECWAHAIASVAAPELAAPAATEVLVQLIVHGALDSQFNNGPLLIFDALALISHGSIDWPRFWRLAARTGALAAAQLVLSLAQTVAPDAPVDWNHSAHRGMPDAVVRSAAQLMINDPVAWDWSGTAGRAIARGWRGALAIGLRGLRRVPERLLTDPARYRPTQQPELPARAADRLRVARWLASH